MTYATWSPTDKSSRWTLSGGDLTTTYDAAGVGALGRGSLSASSGKYYWEVTMGANVASSIVGVAKTSVGTANSLNAVDTYGVTTTGFKWVSGSPAGGYIATYTTGDVIGIALDLDGLTITFYKNGVVATGGAISISSGTYAPAVGCATSAAAAITANFGATAFGMSIPAGFTTWSSPDPGQANVSMQPMTSSGYQAYGNASLHSMTAVAATPAYGVASFLPMVAGNVAGGGSFLSLTGAANAPGAAPSFAAATASGVSVLLPSGGGLFETMTADGAGVAGGVPADTDASRLQFAPMAASGQGSAGSVSAGDALFETLTAAGFGPMSTSIAFQPMSATAVGLTGSVASGAPSFRALTAAIASVGGSMATGSPTFQTAYATALGATQALSSGSASFRALVVAASGLVGSVAAGSASFLPASVAARALATTVASGAPSFLAMAGRATGTAAMTDSRTWVMNVGNEALTEYQNYTFDGYASFNGAYYGAGPTGIYLLDGTDDAGADIAWSFRTGLMDGKKPGLKRLEEVLVAMKVNGPVRVRVWTDDNSYFDYNIPNFRPGVIQQVRTKLGKGLRSRYFRVQVSGVGNVAAEVLSMQLPMIELRRRIG